MGKGQREEGRRCKNACDKMLVIRCCTKNKKKEKKGRGKLITDIA